MPYIYENEQVFLLEELETQTQTVQIKTAITDMQYNEESGEFTEIPPKLEQPKPDQQQAMDVIMSGMADMAARQAEAMDAMMSGMMDLYAQNEELKAEIETLKNRGTA